MSEHIATKASGYLACEDALFLDKKWIVWFQGPPVLFPAHNHFVLSKMHFTTSYLERPEDYVFVTGMLKYYHFWALSMFNKHRIPIFKWDIFHNTCVPACPTVYILSPCLRSDLLLTLASLNCCSQQLCIPVRSCATCTPLCMCFINMNYTEWLV